MSKKVKLLVALLGVAAPLPAWAQAQPWIKDRAYGEGMGIRTGDLELHPGVAGEIGYDSNYFQRSGDDDSQLESPVYSAYRLRITPSLTLSTLSPQRRAGDTESAAPPKVNFRAGLHASYNELIAAGNDYDFSNERHLDAGVGLSLDILPERPVGADVSADYVRTIQPSNDPGANSAWNRDTFHLGPGITWRPGGGMFDWRLGYDLNYNYFEQDAYRHLNNAQHGINTRGRYKFFPRTALIYDAHTVLVRYGGGQGGRNDGQTINARLGFNGLITNHFALLVMAGWAASFYEPTAAAVLSNYDGPIAHAELKWYILPQPRLQPGQATVGLSSIAIGYLRDYSSSYLADYYRRDRGYLGFSYFVGGRFLVDISGGYTVVSHPAFASTAGVNVDPRREHRVDAQLFTEYRLSDSVGINATLRYDGSLRDTYLPLPGDDDNLAFSRITGWVGARWFL